MTRGGPPGRARGAPPVLNLFRDAPPAARAHLRVRWATCPFPAVAEAVPAQGRVLEVGCGHGLCAAYLAIGSHDRRVKGIDVDAGKIGVARAAARRAAAAGAMLSFDVAPPGHLPDGPWDAIVIVDVLYLLDAATQRRLLDDCTRLLAPGGVLVVKEMAPRPKAKFVWNAFQETLSVRVLRITRGNGLTFVPPPQLATWMREAGLVADDRPLHRGYLHPHHLVTGRRPGGTLRAGGG